MPIYAKRSKTFTPAPAGLQYAICCDVVDLGMVASEQFGTISHKVRIKWQSENELPDGKPALIMKDFTLSMHEKAKLPGFVEAWLGRALSDEEKDEFDVESLIDKVCQLNIVHVQSKKGNTFANIASIVPPGKHAPKMAVRSYERECNRPGWEAPKIPMGEDDPPPHTDADAGHEDIPF